MWVIFDNYDVTSTKDPEQKRRRLHQTLFPDVKVENRTPVPPNKAAFLSNKKNKQSLINLLESHLTKAGVNVKQVSDEGDADVLMVRKTLDLAKEEIAVLVVADDTDILILLLHHAENTNDIYLATKQHVVSTSTAMSGCDTTSSLYGTGKLKQFKALQSSQKLRSDVLIFGDLAASKEELRDVGEDFVERLYRGGEASSKGLDELWYLYAISPKCTPEERYF